MASLYRKRYWRTDPKTGKRQRRAYPKWYGKYRDVGGKVRRVPLAKDKKAAQLMLAELVKEAELRRAGVVDPYVAHRLRPLAEHLDDWEAELLAGATDQSGAKLRAGRCRRLVDGCGFALISDVSATKVTKWLADLRTRGTDIACGKGEIKGKKASTQTSNFYLAAAKAFCEWLVDEDRAVKNPLRRLKGGNPELDRRHVRRDLTDAELERLLAVTATQGRRFKLSGPDRALLYLTAAYTGLRAKELNSLDRGNFDLKAAELILRPEQTKNKKGAVLPLHPALVERLRPFVARARSGELLWPGRWAKNHHAGKMLALDLEAAKVEHETKEGVIDFHSFRYTFISRLVKAGVLPKVAQYLARHSTVKLTLDRYSRIGLVDIRSALNALPPFPDGGKKVAS